MSLASIALVLFLIMDPIGNIPPFLNMTSGLNRKRQKWIVFREMLIALAAMLFFNYLGEFFFYALDISETAVRIASGIILFLIAVKILFTSPDSMRANIPKEEPLIFPLAIPLIAGPALLATIMLYAHLEPLQSVMIFAILIAWLFSALILFFAGPIKRILGKNGLIACERLIGIVLVLMSVQRLLEGIHLFWTSHPKS